MSIAVIQMVSQDDVTANLAAARRLLEQAAEGGARLAVLPENFAAMGRRDLAALGRAEARGNGPILPWLNSAARDLRLWIVAGTLPLPPDGQPEAKANACSLLIDEHGGRVARYDKLHLFTPTAEQLAFKAGSELPEMLDLGPWAGDEPAPKAMGVVCYDLRFGPLMDQVRLASPELLWVPAQWPAARDAHWRALIQGRAAELQAFVIGANRCGEETLGAKKRPLRFAGNSLIAGPDGALAAEGQGEEGLVWAEVDLDAARKLRKEVPVSRDRREALYRRWYAGLDMEAAASDPTAAGSESA